MNLMFHLRLMFVTIVLFGFPGATIGASLYEQGKAALDRGDVAASLALLKQGAAQGEPKAQYELGILHESGTGVPKDETKSFEWFRKAAGQGHVGAQAAVGLCYFQGKGVLQDFIEARKWFRIAAEKGNARAQFGLGLMYAQGLGGPTDLVEAFMWANLGGVTDEDARTLRNSLSQMMTPDQISEGQKRSREWKPKLPKTP